MIKKHCVTWVKQVFIIAACLLFLITTYGVFHTSPSKSDYPKPQTVHHRAIPEKSGRPAVPAQVIPEQAQANKWTDAARVNRSEPFTQPPSTESYTLSSPLVSQTRAPFPKGRPFRPQAAGSTPSRRVTAEQQRQANEEANDFVLADFINDSDADSEPGDGTRLTGGIRQTPEELANEEKTALLLKTIHLNKIGFARLNASRARKGLPLLVAGRDVQVAPMGQDMETSAPRSGPAVMGSVDPAEAPSAGPASEVGLSPLPSITAAVSTAAVDNSTLQSFPPIRNQRYNSCAQFSGVYYGLTHETALVRGWNAKTGGDFYRFTPYFTYNMINNGSGSIGSQPEVGWNIAERHGVPRWSEFYGAATAAATEWCTNPAVYRRMLEDRTESHGIISDVDTPAGLDQLKAFLANGHVAVCNTYVFSWKFKTAGDDPRTSDDDTYSGKDVAYMIDGIDGPHSVTVVGYDDSIWCDINGDGSVDANEKGALRVANSWGTGWKESGFTWISYNALRTRNPQDTYFGIFWGDKVYYVTPRSTPHIPRVVAKITVNHTQRNETAILEVGVGDSGSSAPNTSQVTKIHTEVYDGRRQGGPFSYSGAAPASEDFTYYLDFTDMIPTQGESKRWFLKLGEFAAGGSELALKEFELYSAQPGGDVLVASHSSLPVTVDDATEWIGIDWTYDAPNHVSPVADSESVSTLENTDLALTLNATDADRNLLTYSILTQPPHGTLNGTPPNLTYTPDEDYFGSDSFIWKVNDGTNDSNIATVTIDVTGFTPEITVVATDAEAAEDGEDPGTWTITRTGVGANIRFPLNVAFSLGGTATISDDFTLDAGTQVTIPADQNSTTITLTPVDEATRGERYETSILTISDDAAYAITTASATITIADDDNFAPVVDTSSEQAVTLAKMSIPSAPSEWSSVAWTGDTDSGVDSRYTYMAAHCFRKDAVRDDPHADPIITVNGEDFANSVNLSDSGWSVAETVTPYTDGVGHLTESSKDLVKSYIYHSSPITITFSDLTVGGRYKATFFGLGWGDDEANRSFAMTGGTSTVINQNVYGESNGITISCEYTATGATQEFTIDPISGGFPLYALANRDEGLNQATATLDGTVTDADANVQTTTWTKVSGPEVVEFANPSAVDTTATFFAEGTYVLRLTADDGYTSVSDEVTITVSLSSPPSATYTAWASETFTNPFNDTVLSSDPDGDGRNNLWEFAFGTDPTLSQLESLAADGSAHGDPIPVTDDGGATFDFLFVRRDDHGTSGSLTYTVQFSSDLETFYDSADTPTLVADSSADADYEVVKLPYPATLPNGQKATFARIWVVESP